MKKDKWYQRLDGTLVYKVGRYKVLEIFKRPHNGFSCLVFKLGCAIWSEGSFGTFFPTPTEAKKWGISKAKELKII